MERFSDLAIILKAFPYQERDRIAVCFTENHGRITALAKGGVNSRRFGGSLDFLVCSKIEFVQKPNAEMARIDEAVIHHEFRNLHRNFEYLTCASFVTEFCLKLLEPHSPSREMFVLLSNVLFRLDAGIPVQLAINAFLCKAFKIMGYPPSLLRCVQCSKGAHEISESGGVEFFWYSDAGGMICSGCAGGRFKVRLSEELLLFFHKLTMTPFKDLSWDLQTGRCLEEDLQAPLYRVLTDFLHHHIPGLPPNGLKSWKLLNDSLVTASP